MYDMMLNKAEEERKLAAVASAIAPIEEEMNATEQYVALAAKTKSAPAPTKRGKR